MSFFQCNCQGERQDDQDVRDAEALPVFENDSVINATATCQEGYRSSGAVERTISVGSGRFKSGGEDSQSVRFVHTIVKAPDLPNHGIPDPGESYARQTSADSCDPSLYMSQRTYWASEIDPSQLVSLDEEFDFYSSSSKRIQVMKMADVHGDVLHLREGKAAATPMGRTSSKDSSSSGEHDPARKISSDSGGSDGSDSVRSINSGSSRSDLDDDQDDMIRKRSTLILSRSKSTFDAENVTNWGTLMAKVLRRRLRGISSVIEKAVHNRRHSVRTEKCLPKQYILPSVAARAQYVVDQIKIFSRMVELEPEDQFDHNWMVGGMAMHKLFGADFVDTLMLLANTVRKIFSSQPVLAECKVPCRVFGDIHGQLRDLLLLFRAFGLPGDRKTENVSFVFNGDFVDRGRHSIEVIGILFALKIKWPEKIWLVRGNHEDRAMNERYGFEKECYSNLGDDLGEKTFELINRAFDELPLACLIAEKVLVVHGGLGEGKFVLNDIRAVERPLREASKDNMVWNILWSDPIEDDKLKDQQGVFGVHTSPRSATGLFKFGWNITKTFCAINGLGLIIRSHQSKAGSLGFSVMHDNMLIRVFSARDYEEHGNDGAVLLVSPDETADPDGMRGSIKVRPQVFRSMTKSQSQGKGKKIAHKKSKERRNSKSSMR